MCEKHRKVSRVALTVLSKKAAYKSEKGYASQLLLKCKTLSVQPLIRSDETDL